MEIDDILEEPVDEELLRNLSGTKNLYTMVMNQVYRCLDRDHSGEITNMHLLRALEKRVNRKEANGWVVLRGKSFNVMVEYLQSKEIITDRSKVFPFSTLVDIPPERRPKDRNQILEGPIDFNLLRKVAGTKRKYTLAVEGMESLFYMFGTEESRNLIDAKGSKSFLEGKSLNKHILDVFKNPNFEFSGSVAMGCGEKTLKVLEDYALTSGLMDVDHRFWDHKKIDNPLEEIRKHSFNHSHKIVYDSLENKTLEIDCPVLGIFRSDKPESPELVVGTKVDLETGLVLETSTIPIRKIKSYHRLYHLVKEK
ncbi:MAG: hypothetical protein KKG60_03780 [Nanoarchaeota archaeon]|nr:hypothetical protein [Nanoarchaeota archaeon]